MIYAIDFDNVIHDTANIPPGRRMGPPMPGAADALREFSKCGIQIIVFTVMDNESKKKAVEDWLKYFDIPFDEVTNIKPCADLYLDDKAIRFTSWQEFLSGGIMDR